MTLNERRETIELLGRENVARCISFTMEELNAMYEKDKNLNLHMPIWDRAAGFCSVYVRKTETEEVHIIGSPLINLMKEKLGKRYFSNATNVFILKQCAIDMINANK